MTMEETTNNTGSTSEGGETLIVASKLKNYIRTKSGMNTSSAVIDVLSGRVRQLADQAIENARRDGRKTVMDRDFT
jgi:histone H3/H4